MYWHEARNPKEGLVYRDEREEAYVFVSEDAWFGA